MLSDLRRLRPLRSFGPIAVTPPPLRSWLMHAVLTGFARIPIIRPDPSYSNWAKGHWHISSLWGRSSAGRASRSQCEGREFDPPRLHQISKTLGSPRSLRLDLWLLGSTGFLGLFGVPSDRLSRASFRQSAIGVIVSKLSRRGALGKGASLRRARQPLSLSYRMRAEA